MGVWKGALAAAALLWAGTAQAAYIEFSVSMTGTGYFGAYSPDFSEYNEWSGKTTAGLYFYVEEGQNGGVGTTVGDSILSARVYSYECGACSASFSATLPGGTFPNGAAPLSGSISPLASTASAYFEGSYSYQAFNGVVTSITARRVDQHGDGGAWISPVHRYPVPEPATWALLLTGFAAIGSAMRRRLRITQAI